MAELVKWLLTAQGLSVSGVSLAFLGIVLVGMQKRWWVPGWVYKNDTDHLRIERDEYKTALSLRHAEDQADVKALRKTADDLRDQLLWEDAEQAARKRRRPHRETQ